MFSLSLQTDFNKQKLPPSFFVFSLHSLLAACHVRFLIAHKAGRIKDPDISVPNTKQTGINIWQR